MSNDDRCRDNMKCRAIVMLFGMFLTSNALANCSTNDLSSLDRFLSKKGFSKFCYQKLSSQHAIVNVSINGKQSHFVLDSGASVSVVNNDELIKFRLIPTSQIDNAQATGLGGHVNAQSFNVDSLKIQNFKTNTTHIFAMDLSHVVNALNSISSVPIAGVIGQDILVAHEAIIDIASNTLYLKP